jgi:glycine/D-amino acid oxidase-like deaminating enzyme
VSGQPRVAVVGPFSGPRAAWGDLLLDAIGSESITWERYDDRGDADHARRQAERIVADGGYAAVVGHFNSLGAAAAIPLYRAAGIPVLLPLATRPGLLAGGGGVLRWCPDDAAQVDALTRVVRARGNDRFDVVHDGTDYGRQLAARFSGAAEPGAGAAVVCGTHHGAARVARDMRAGGYAGLLAFTDDCAVAEFPDLAGDAASDALVAQLAGGAAGLVDDAVGALTAALRGDPCLRGEVLLAAVRAEASVEFTVDGEPAGIGWEVVCLGGSPVLPAALDLRLDSAAQLRNPTAPHRSADVVVIGGGVVGAATAAALAPRTSVLVLDDPAGPAATGYSGALVRAFEPDPELRALALASHQQAWGRPEAADRYGFRRTGALVLLGPEHLAEAERGVAELRDAAVAAELLTPNELARRWPAMSPAAIAAAVWEPGGGYACPRCTRTSLLAGVPVLGARALRIRAGAETLVETDAGTITARAVVFAAGCATPGLAADHTSVLAGTRTRRIRYAYFAWHGRPMPAVIDLVTGVWGRPHGVASFLAGRPVDEWDVPAGGGEEDKGADVGLLRDGVSVRWPQLATAPHEGGRHGVDLYRDAGPVLATVSAEPFVVAAAGWSGGGFKTAPAAGERAAELALGS